jgi:SAM-dependent methyltransferase
VPSLARYDDHVAWYEKMRPVLDEVETHALTRLLGPGSGRCLDLGCGTGVAIPALQKLGWTVVGVDASDLMLARAATHDVELVRASGDALPFADETFDAVVSLWTHTDVDEFSAMVREAARVLSPSAPFVYIGAHPCFIGPHSWFVRGQGTPKLHPGYASTTRYREAPGVSPDGLRAKVGATHLPLGAFLHAFLDARLTLESFEELGLEDPERHFPYRIALRCRR